MKLEGPFMYALYASHITHTPIPFSLIRVIYCRSHLRHLFIDVGSCYRVTYKKYVDRHLNFLKHLNC